MLYNRHPYSTERESWISIGTRRPLSCICTIPKYGHSTCHDIYAMYAHSHARSHARIMVLYQTGEVSSLVNLDKICNSTRLAIDRKLRSPDVVAIRSHRQEHCNKTIHFIKPSSAAAPCVWKGMHLSSLWPRARIPERPCHLKPHVVSRWQSWHRHCHQHSHARQ